VRAGLAVWRAASHPAAFFAGLGEEPRLGRAAAVAAASAAVGALIAGFLALRVSGSDAWAPFLLAGPALALPYVAIIAVLGGLVLMRPSGMDLRAFEVVAWAWTPSGLLALSLLPIGLLVPGPALAGGLAMLPAWHLWLVWRGVQSFAAGGVRTAFALYAAAVFGLPLALLAFTVSVLARLA